MRRLINKYVITIFGFSALWFGGIPLVFTKTIPVICTNISHNSPYNVEIISPQITTNIVPTANIFSDKIIFEHKDTKNTILIEKPKIKIRILPLISGKIHINSLTIDKFVVNADLDKKVELDKNFFNKLKSTKFKLDELMINSLKLIVNQKQIEKPIIYSSDNLFYKKNNKFIKLNLNSQLQMLDIVSSTKVNVYIPKKDTIHKNIVDIEVRNFNLAPLGNYLKQYLPQDIVDVKGIINAKVNKEDFQATLSNCAFIMKDSSKSVIFPEQLNINSNFNLTNKKLILNNLEFLSKNINAKLNGSISNYLDTSLSQLDLNVQLHYLNVEDLVKILPPIILEEINLQKLKKYKFFGNAIGNFSITGNPIEPEINGEVFISKGVLSKPIPNTKGAILKLDFIGKYLNYDVVVPTAAYDKVMVKGGVELYNIKYADMRIWSTKNVDLKIVQEKLVPIHEILNFVIGPIPIMNISGIGNVDIYVKGNRKNPHIWGTINFDNVETFFHDMPSLILKNASASLTFNDQNGVFKLLKGKVNNQDFYIDGVCDVFGGFNFKVKSDSQNIEPLYKAIRTSKLIPEINKLLPDLEVCKGNINLDLNILGNVKNIFDLKFNENFFTSGEITLLNNIFGLQNIILSNTKGKISFDKLDVIGDITSIVGKSPVAANIVLKNNIADVSVEMPSLYLSDILNTTNEIKKNYGNIILDVTSKYKGNIHKIEFDKLNILAKVTKTSPKNKLLLQSGQITLKNDKLKVKDFKGNFINQKSSFNINLTGDNISKNPNFNGKIYVKDFELALINDIVKNLDLPQITEIPLQQIRFDAGEIDLLGIIHNNKINASTNIGGIELTYLPFELPIKILNGNLSLYNNYLMLNKLNVLADNMPLFIDGKLQDITNKQEFDIYLNSKPQQDFIDKYINRNQIYPIKIKGDIVYSAKLKGNKNNYDLKSNINMSKDSSVYYLGAMVGDVENAIVLNLDTNIQNGNSLKIREFAYDKLISSQARRQNKLNMLKAKGGIDVYKEDLNFHNLYIKTQNPTDARIFNIIFRKPNIKQGQFTSDLKLNGKLSNPKLIGDFHIFETNIPFLDTTMKSITFTFKDKIIEFHSIGEVLSNDIVFKGVLKNKLTTPYYVENAELYTKLLDLNHTTNKLKHNQIENSQALETLEGVDIKNIVIKNLKTKADSIKLRNIVAENFEAYSSLDENHTLNIKDFKFNIAKGSLNGSFKYNLDDSKTLLSFNAKEINANDLSYALFDLNNQIYGDLTGEVSLTCDGQNFEKCLQTLNGNTVFNVANGRIPKLGSLEYLLKAGNLVKGGFTGISINSIIDLITPLKTGDFDSIYGQVGIYDGVAKEIEIASRGKDLSLFITGNYNFSTSVAEMVVLGMLSRKISTMFGPIGNVSINTLFNVIPGVDLSKDTKIREQINKIPGIELSSKAFRKFVAEIKGDIDGEDYVTSFKWIN